MRTGWYYLYISGSKLVEIAGTNAIIKTTNSMSRTNGTARDAIFRIGSPVIPETTKRFKPSGGVMKPTPKAVIIITQNCISFMPILSAKGFKIGARITIFGVVSITQPAKMSIPIIISIKR